MGHKIYSLSFERVLTAIILGVFIGSAIGYFGPTLTQKPPESNYKANKEFEQAYGALSSEQTNLYPSRPNLYCSLHTITGKVTGPVATLSYHSIFVNRTRRNREISDEITAPLSSVIHDFSITERGVWYKAKVKAKTAARRDYDRQRRASIDPGLLEFVSDGNYKFNLFPILPDRTPKQAKFKVESVLSPNEGNKVRLPLWKCYVPNEQINVNIEIYEPRKISQWHLPEGIVARKISKHSFILSGSLSRVPSYAKNLEVSWTLATPKETTVFSCKNVGYIIQRKNVSAGDKKITVSIVASDPELRGVIGKLIPRDSKFAAQKAIDVILPSDGAFAIDVEEETFVRLGAMAKIMRLHHSPKLADRKIEMAKLADSHKIVSPLSSLYAKPGLIFNDSLQTICNEKLSEPRTLSYKTKPFKGGSSFTRSALPVTSIPIFTGFRKARERANERACFANQKTIAGAIEMYNLDNNTYIGYGGTRAPLRTLEQNEASVSSLFHGNSGVLAEAIHNHQLTFGQKKAELEDNKRVGLLAPHFNILRKQGYLQTIPDCPGAGDNSCANYILIDGNLFCLRHGFISSPCSPLASPREQLQEIGIKDKLLLSFASPDYLGNRSRGSCSFELELLPAFILLLLMWFRGNRRHKRYETAGFLSGLFPAFLLATTYVRTLYVGSIIHIVFPVTIIYMTYDFLRD